MKVMYHPDRDGLRILFSDAPIERSTSELSGLIVDYDNNGVVVGLELTQASERMPNPRLVEYAEIPSATGAANSPDEP
ncbi:MAG: DUF2283 domain-containing protein [Armatimonadota bacterium]